MRFNRHQIWFLVGYLGLLLNLGESLHHAEIFGLHDHGCAAACCHCCGHSAPGQDSEHSPPTLTSDHDCNFCKFFAQYHVTAAQVELPEKSSFTFLHYWNRPAQTTAVIRVPLARGPPVVA